MKFLDWIPTNFGFANAADFIGSLIHPKFAMITLPLAVVSGMIEAYLGLDILTIVAFTMLVTVEFASGIIAAKMKGEKIQSKKFGRFGFKLFVWLCAIFVVNSMKLQYGGDGTISEAMSFQVFDWLHSSIIIYVCLEYLISVLENMAVISKDRPSPLIRALKVKLNKWFDLEPLDEEEQNK